MSPPRYRVRPSTFGGGATVIDTERQGLDVAWCGDAFSVWISGSFRVDGAAEAERICRLLNEAEIPRPKRKRAR